MKQFKSLVKFLRSNCPLAFPVEVRRVAIKHHDGLCLKKCDRFLIKINKNLDEIRAIETLLHEWSHARAWKYIYDSLSQEEFENISHDASWGVAYAEVYSIFQEKFLNY